MKDLFSASQTKEVAASRLLITHFHHVIKYPGPHISGILDAILDLAKDSFLNLKVLGFDFNEKYSVEFERDVRCRLPANS